MDVYDLIIALMGFFPGIGPALIAVAATLGTVVAAVSAGLGAARVLVKLTFWTKADDVLLAKFEAWHERITNGPLAPLFKVMDRLSLLKDTVKS